MNTRMLHSTGAVAAALLANPLLATDDPFADAVVAYAIGADGNPAYADPSTTLGAPERFTGEGIFPGVVSVFNPAFGTDEIVSIGKGGSLVVRFDTPVTDDPGNPFGVDLIVFGNTAFIDGDWPSGIVQGLFGDDGGSIEVSADGTTWITVPGVPADGPFPTAGFLDSGPYDGESGSVETDFTKPVDPALGLADFVGSSNDEVLALYAGSGGGAGIDLAGAGLAAVSFVRVSNPADALVDLEIDAFSDVSPVSSQPGDVDGDGYVDFADLLDVLLAWGVCPPPPQGCPADLDGDGDVGFADLLIVLTNWTA